MRGPSTCRLFLLRHGEVANAQEPVYNGHHDVDLSDTGLNQVRVLADTLRSQPIRAVYSSDLIRTRKGAELIADAHQLQPVIVPEFRELSVGIWGGKTVREVEEKYPEQVAERRRNLDHFHPPEGESFQMMQDRVLPQFREMVARHDGETIVLMAHGGVNRAILSHYLEFPLKYAFRIAQQFAAVNILQFYQNDMVVELVNGTHNEIH